MHCTVNAQRTALSSSNIHSNPLLRMENNEIIDCTPQSIDCIVQPSTKIYSVEQLIKILNVQRRQVFNYSKTICSTWSWENETVFKPSYGCYSERMLGEMRSLKSLGVDEYQRVVGRQNHRPVAMKMPTSALTVVENSAVILDSRIANLQQSAIANSEALANQLRTKLEEIKRQNILAQQQTTILSDAELLAAQNQGYLQAIQIHQAQTQAKQTALAQLRAMQLEEQ